MFVWVGHVVLLFSFYWTNAGISLVNLLRDFLIGYLFKSISDILVYFSHNKHIFFVQKKNWSKDDSTTKISTCWTVTEVKSEVAI